jgi:hypothetical protein
MSAFNIIIRIVLTLAVSFEISVVSVRAEPLCDLKFLREVITPIHHELMSPEDLALIERWFADEAMTKNDAARKSFELYLGKRFQFLPDEVQEKVLRIYNHRYHFENTAQIDSEYRPIFHEIIGRYPKEMRGTIGQYFIDSHELEHAIQEASTGLKGQWSRLRTKTPQFYAQRFEEEYGAMVAEWNYIRAIPRSVRDQMLQDLKSASLSEYDRDFLKRVFSNADETLEDYLKREWAADRYSPEEFKELAERKRVLVERPETETDRQFRLKVRRWSYAGSSVALTVFTCLQLKKNASTDSGFYQKVCHGIFRLR